METVNNATQATDLLTANLVNLSVNAGSSKASAELAQSLVKERQGSYEDVKELHDTIVELTDTNATLTTKLDQAEKGVEKVKLVIVQEARYGETEKIVRYEATPAVLDLLKPIVTAELDKKYKSAVTENIMLKDELAKKDAEKLSALRLASTDAQASKREVISELNNDHKIEIQDLEDKLCNKDIEISKLNREIKRLQDNKDYANLEIENAKLQGTITRLSRRFINFTAIKTFFFGA